MQAEPVQDSRASVHPELKDPFRSDLSDEAIQACYELLSSGRPLSEILDAAKRIASTNKASHSNIGREPGDAQISDIAGEARGASSKWGTAQVAERVEPRLVGHSRDSSGALTPGTRADAPHTPVALKVRQSPESARVEAGGGTKFCRLIGAALFWLIPAISLTILGISGKSLVEVDLLRMAAEATAKAIPPAVQRGEDLPATTTAEAEKIQPSSPTLEASRAASQITPEQIRALLDRGDALLKLADVTSARLLYETAAVGNAEAALRLGATYDPSFLAQAGFESVGGDPAAADYWYQRARDLGSDADIASFGQQIESARAAKQVVTVSPAEPVTEPGTTGQARIQSTDRRSQSDMTDEPTRQAALGVHRRATGGPRPAHGRYTRIQRPTNGQRCPHSGNCLTPP
jgi:hypothetical protein